MPAAQNHLIDRLPRPDRLRLLAACERVPLRPSQILCRSGQVIRHAYFPIGGLISLLTRDDEQPSIEVGMVGREGMLGMSLVLGVGRAPLGAMVQGAGEAWRLAAPALKRELLLSAALRRCLNRYIAISMAGFATSVGCQHAHLLAPRLARWLLMSLDRASGRELLVTQSWIARMLGVRREGVTEIALKLQAAGLIRYARGHITVLDRGGLESRSCGCYAASRLEYERLLPGLAPASAPQPPAIPG